MAGERFTAEGSFSALDVFAFNWQNQTGSLTLELYAWDTDYATTLSGTAIASQVFTDYPNNSALKLVFPAVQEGDYLWVLKNPAGKVGVWSTANSTHPNTAYMNGAAVTGDYASRIYYTDAANAEMSGYPFASDAPNNFSTYLNRMWSIYGAVNDGTNAVYKFGNEPTYFDWIATKLLWSNEAAYKQELRNKVRDFAIGSDGYVWSWSNLERWPSGESLHYGNNVNYIIAVYKILSWENSTDFLNEVDATTSAAGDVSSGLTVRQKVDMAMNYILNELNGSNGLLIIDNGENTGKADGHASNYWDNLKYGYKEGYSNIYFYQSLLAMSGIERMTGDASKAARFAELAETSKANYDSAFWDASKGRYVATIDEDGKAWDFGFTFQNMEALANGLGDNAKATRIYDWLDGRRIIDGDTSTIRRARSCLSE